MKKFLAILILIPALTFAQARRASKQNVIAFTNVTIIDATGAPPQPDMTVVVRGNRIVQREKTAGHQLPRAAHIISCKGKFLIPGLWDMHGHLTNATETAFPLMIMNGVTGVRDMGGDLKQIDRWRAEILTGRRLGPHIIRAGPFVDGPKPGVPNRLTVTNPAEGRRAVDELKARGVDFIKVHNGLSRESFFAVADEARKVALPLAVHLPSGLWTLPKGDGVSIAEASDAGAASIEHIEILQESALYARGHTAKTEEDAYAENFGPAGTELFAKFVRNQTWYVPTLVAYYKGFVLWGDDQKEIAERRKDLANLIALTGAMHNAGVQVMAGSDFSDWAIVPGVDLHNELGLLVEAGFSPMEALQAATIKPAEFLRQADSLGTIEKGKIADMVLLTANPLEDISHTRMIDSVVLNGRLIPVAKMLKLLTTSSMPSTKSHASGKRSAN